MKKKLVNDLEGNSIAYIDDVKSSVMFIDAR